MIEITLQNLLSRMDSINHQLFNFGSKTRIYVTPVEVSPNSYLKGNQFEIRKYNTNDVPIVSTVLRTGDKSEVFHYQQAVFDTIKILKIEKKPTITLEADELFGMTYNQIMKKYGNVIIQINPLKKEKKKVKKTSDKNEFISK